MMMQSWKGSSGKARAVGHDRSLDPPAPDLWCLHSGEAEDSRVHLEDMESLPTVGRMLGSQCNPL